MSEEAFFTMGPVCPHCGATPSAVQALLHNRIVVNHDRSCPRYEDKDDDEGSFV